MKWLLIAFSLFKQFAPHSDSGTMVNPVAEIKDFIKDNALKVILIFMIASAMSSLFVAGIVIAAVNVAYQYDQTMNISFTAMLATGLILVLLSAGFSALYYANAKSSDKIEKVKQSAKNIGSGHPLQDALAVLVMDFVKEREFRRTQAPATNSSYPHRETDGSFSEVDRH